MLDCLHCGVRIPRLAVAQRYCPPCERRVAELARQDAARRRRRFGVGKDLTGQIR